MGILQTAYKTYITHENLAGVSIEGKEMLAPISHIVKNAEIEITISNDGNFLRSEFKNNEKTIIPATIESANRTSKIPHPLCDQLQYVASCGYDKFDAYVELLSGWADSEFSHPKVQAVLKYVKNGTIINDLLKSGVITDDKDKYEKYLVRWRIIPAPDGTSENCWEDISLFQSFIKFYTKLCAQTKQDICMVTGKRDMICQAHIKGIVSINGNAKLLSANDNSNFTYRGRFSNSQEAYNVGYTASQKAHNALRWLTANEGVRIGGRTFICWNPEGKSVPANTIFGLPNEETFDYEQYKKQLHKTLHGYEQALQKTDDIIIASFDAATTGRLSVTYYNELKSSDFFRRVEHWYETMCWLSQYNNAFSPSIERIIKCAFGVPRENFIDIDERMSSEHVQRLLHCIVDKMPIPEDIVRALVSKSSNLLIYKNKNREYLLSTTCAVLRKYKNDKLNKEEYTLSLDTTKTDRSYLFGRLLAIAENVERSTYDKGEKRETNAIRMQSVFNQRPLYAWRIIEESLNPYYARLSPGLRIHYKNIIGEITGRLPPVDNPELGKKLADTYLLGYYHQRSALYEKKETKIEEDLNNEPIEE